MRGGVKTGSGSVDNDIERLVIDSGEHRIVGNLDSQGRLVITSAGDTITFKKVR
jgi:hypothetical protein